ncbi:hypothetical protein GGR46_004328 [Sphingomonas kyeonggiensis]|uniref:Trypsin-like peptidase n=1 Tax=Sphingomonas kyeonggiensis TaxID=1268553 RepID=A0A7W6JY96_9SPHN|nr:hypothetical protein [Sphingomonas kyeonggiensis]
MDAETPLLFTEDDWNEAVPLVVANMTAHLAARRAPVFFDRGDHGEGWGSGGFIALGDRTFVLTNEHVAAARSPTQPLASQLSGQDILWRFTGDHAHYPAPLDLAVLPVPKTVWHSTHDSAPIEVDDIVIGHHPVPGELLALSGFAGERVGFHFESLISEATCSVAREVPLPPDARFDPRYHFGVDYRPDLATQVIGAKGLPVPPGLSGSIVWDCRFVAAKMAGEPWTPALAQVTGVVWGWPSDLGCLVATRAEYVDRFCSAWSDRSAFSPEAPTQSRGRGDQGRFLRSSALRSCSSYQPSMKPLATNRSTSVAGGVRRRRPAAISPNNSSAPARTVRVSRNALRLRRYSASIRGLSKLLTSLIHR